MLCYCRYFDETFTAMLLAFIVVVILGLNLGNSQVSVYRTIGPTLVNVYNFLMSIISPFYLNLQGIIDMCQDFPGMMLKNYL